MPDPQLFSAEAQLPFPDLERAETVLRGELRAIGALEVDPADGPAPVLDWGTLTVDGPVVRTGPDGRSRFTYTGTATSRAEDGG